MNANVASESLRVLLVEHMDDVLREALDLSDPEALFGKRPRPMEYQEGVLVPAPSYLRCEKIP